MITLEDARRRRGLEQARPQAQGLADEAFSPSEWWAHEPPARDWVVEGAFLRGTVALVSSDGGLGKSLLMQQLCTAAALGREWLGQAVKRCRAYALFCEDDKEELHRRQEAINRHYQCDSSDLDDLCYRSRPGQENVIAAFEKWGSQAKPTPLFQQIRERVLEMGAQLVVFDTASDVFGGNEIARDQVRSFISMLRRLAIECQGVVVLTAHVSNEGLASGSGLAGNRAWSNSVRSRLYLHEAKPLEKGGEPPADERVLRGMKSNYGPRGAKITLRWRRGVFERVEAPKLLDWTEPQGGG